MNAAKNYNGDGYDDVAYCTGVVIRAVLDSGVDPDRPSLPASLGDARPGGDVGYIISRLDVMEVSTPRAGDLVAYDTHIGFYDPTPPVGQFENGNDGKYEPGPIPVKSDFNLFSAVGKPGGLGYFTQRPIRYFRLRVKCKNGS